MQSIGSAIRQGDIFAIRVNQAADGLPQERGRFQKTLGGEFVGPRLPLDCALRRFRRNQRKRTLVSAVQPYVVTKCREVVVRVFHGTSPIFPERRMAGGDGSG